MRKVLKWAIVNILETNEKTECLNKEIEKENQENL